VPLRAIRGALFFKARGREFLAVTQAQPPGKTLTGSLCARPCYALDEQTNRFGTRSPYGITIRSPRP
jgi:hypothetical protein